VRDIENKNTTNTWIQPIDPIRGIAAFSVVLCHSIESVDGLNDNYYTIARWLGSGGVGMFFLISGFCIHLPQAKNSEKNIDYNIDWKNFAFRRFWRLVPIHYIAIFLSLLAVCIFPDSHFLSPFNLNQLIYHLLFIHVWIDKPTFYSFNMVFWSIAVEVHFYCCYPLFWQFRKKFGSIKPVFFYLLISIIFYFYISKYFNGDKRFIMQQLFIITFWQWSLGALLSDIYLKYYSRLQNLKIRLPISVIALLAIVVQFIVYFYDITLSNLHLQLYLTPLLFFIALFYLTCVAKNFLNYHIFNFSGRASYSIYLVHILGISIVNGLLPRFSANIQIFINLLLGLIFGASFYYIFEQYFTNKQGNLFLVLNKRFRVATEVKD
jgi:peptidoglycan/LPS O-acetylase OafA/YrhL